MNDLKSVFVVYLDYGYEGNSIPQRVFATEELASLFVQGAEMAGGIKAKITMLDVHYPKDYFSPSDTVKP